MYQDRIKPRSLWAKVVTPEEAALHIKDGMTVGMSGFTRAGEAKAVPMALAERGRRENFKISLLTGASLGNDLDKTLAEANVLARRMPFQADPALRKRINAGEVMFVDQHLSETVEMIRSRQLGPIDVAIIEAVMIKEDGSIVPTTSVGNSATFAMLAEKVIVEINMTLSPDLEGMHDIYIPTRRPFRGPIPITNPRDRAGMPSIPLDPSRIAAVVISAKQDSCSNIAPPDDETKAIARHLSDFLGNEVAKARLSTSLAPLQAGIGSIANAVMHGFIDTDFHDLTMYSEVLQDSTFDLFDAGKLTFASGSSLTLSQERNAQVFADFSRYKNRLVLRPQEISNHPEVIRRLGLIAINTALEADIYGNVNSTHVMGSQMMNGIGGSGDFARNAYLSVFVTKSTAKDGRISSIVPFVSHVDHCEHDVDLIITEQGLADLRGLAPRERAKTVLANCIHPDYRDIIGDYMRDAERTVGGQTPHILERAFEMHMAYRDHGDMRQVGLDRAAAAE
ncbi:acetyl-CoA hydrolase/transferase family protein [Roseospira marina]|uniref:Acetyl-CoA hydrolase/transferase family protein n=1 Tax=Roseospira marina TaxID=140057 RepID=A0A5M6ICV8_9PROT|nr:acetyl-CoA hydrolase/transferase family protein [Roseospira marina]KAA5605599.1 acetyl-CoA hydrolase/transferase family protein [Roseospira marina]MBB4313333.1 succinyl-CoA:acetate CoA-transferase [Roseospira marina]MBB5085926.1 succinyl-CoA:acetate CoA-transferase [Roseospira marina]